MHHTIVEINLKQFIKNLLFIKQRLYDKVKICLPVKANAYGHGLTKIAMTAQPYVDYFGVACLNEGIELRRANIDKSILVFGGVLEKDIYDLIEYNLDITISSIHKANIVQQYANSIQRTCKVHLKIDTGMNRIGVRAENAIDFIDHVLTLQNIEIVGIYSHLANSDTVNQLTEQQLELFDKIVKYIKIKNPNIICHIANSGGMINYQHAQFDMVRPGILSYGYSIDNNIPVAPCLAIKSKIIYFKVVDAHHGISYNHTCITNTRTRVVTISIGYADGLSRQLSNIGSVLIRGNEYPIVGNICMDMCMVDIGYDGVAYTNDEVIIIGKQGLKEITLASIATKCNTITHEVLCWFDKSRLTKIYIESDCD